MHVVDREVRTIRVKNSIRNITAGYIGQFLSFAMAFVTRTVLIRHISMTYIGLNGVFSNLLMIFSIANLGVGSAVSYALYKPLADEDEEHVSQLVILLRKYYIYIGLVTLVIGIAFMPFLHHVVMSQDIVEDFYLLYIAFLISNVTPYFTGQAYRILLQADQKIYIDHMFNYGMLFLMNVAQIVVIITSRNYLYYILVQLVKVLVTNLLVSNYTNKTYPYLTSLKRSAPLTIETVSIRENIHFALVDNIGRIAMTSTDSLVIARFIGLAVTGIYSNYQMIIVIVHAVIAMLFRSISGSLGNLNVKGRENHKKLIFETVVFVTNFIYGSCVIGIFFLLNDLIRLWLGEAYLLNDQTLLFIALGFYFSGLREPYIYQKRAMGLFRQGRYLRLIMAVVNISLSLILVQYMGISGVFVGTVVSHLLLSYWYDPFMLYKYGFSGGSLAGVMTQLKYSFVTFLSGWGVYLLFYTWHPDGFISFILKFAATALILMVVQGIIYHRSAPMKLLLKISIGR